MPADTVTDDRRPRAGHAGSRRRGRAARRSRDVAARARREEARPDPGRRQHPSHVRRPHRRRRRARRDPARRRSPRLIGPNGAGKTTFFNLLTGFDQPDEGDWSFDGKQPQGRRRPTGSPGCGMVRTFQLTKVLSKLTVIENMRARRHRAARREPLRRRCSRRSGAARRRANTERADELLERFKLDEKREDFAGSPVRRPAQAARDGPGADGRPRDGHARRADGRA